MGENGYTKWARYDLSVSCLVGVPSEFGKYSTFMMVIGQQLCVHKRKRASPSHRSFTLPGSQICLKTR